MTVPKAVRLALVSIVLVGLTYCAGKPASDSAVGDDALLNKIQAMHEIRPDRPVPEEGDRPPIIISDGSINMMIWDEPAKAGEWKDTNGQGKVWRHDFSSVSQTVKVGLFQFSVFRGLPNANAPGCSDPSKAFLTDSLTVASMSNTVSLTLNVSGGDAFATFNTPAALHGKAKFWLRHQGSPPLKSVTFTASGTNTAVTCEFDQGGGPNRDPSMIEVLQRR